MPIYEYICNACRKEFSILSVSAARTKAVCPHCGSVEVTKKLSSFSCSLPTGFSGGTFSGGG
ncbi:MAG: zinc ribbon domain-containing protein [Nitrospirota bacterium]|jgi:putative FmdB family regulatory protein